MKKTTILWLFVSAVLLIPLPALAQVTVGSQIPATRGALLEIKAQQVAGSVSAVTDNNNITAGLGEGALLLPRVQLVSITTLEPFIAVDDPEFTINANSLKEKLAGLMVYNITNNGAGSALYPAVYTWDGEKWATTQANEAAASIKEQPKAFTFYELGTESPVPLKFVVEGLGDWTYQWYQVTGSNVHVRIATPVGQSGTISGAGATTESFTPTGVRKGSTRNANYTGFYKFYCIAKSSLGAELTSEIAEVAVGCGAKNNAGEWVSFMCFNLGADDDMTIDGQKSYPIGSYTNETNGKHAYIIGEEKPWGDLFQWGRIVDGHEKRNSAVVALGAMTTNDIASGSRCTATDLSRPLNQIKRGTSWHGNFITSTSAINYNWNPSAQSDADQLWRTSRFLSNDPCAHYKIGGTYQEFWHDGIDMQNNGDAACTDAGTAWRAPTIDEWGNVYKGGMSSGTPDVATANTWEWYGGTASTFSSIRGYEIKPDGETTTLFLPAAGNREMYNGLLFYQGARGDYWSVSIPGVSAYSMLIRDGAINPGNNAYRGYGFSIRCIKNS